MLPQEESLDILIEFLIYYGYYKVNNIPLDVIRKLAWIVIKENVFIYQNEFYRQAIAGEIGSTLALALANVFIWKWKKRFVSQQKCIK